MKVMHCCEILPSGIRLNHRFSITGVLRRNSCASKMILWLTWPLIIINYYNYNNWTFCYLQQILLENSTMFILFHGCSTSLGYSSCWQPMSTTPLMSSWPSTCPPDCSCITTLLPITELWWPQMPDVLVCGSRCLHFLSPSVKGVFQTSLSIHWEVLFCVLNLWLHGQSHLVALLIRMWQIYKGDYMLKLHLARQQGISSRYQFGLASVSYIIEPTCAFIDFQLNRPKLEF